MAMDVLFVSCKCMSRHIKLVLDLQLNLMDVHEKAQVRVHFASSTGRVLSND
jgi:hypothetical protein